MAKYNDKIINNDRELERIIDEIKDKPEYWEKMKALVEKNEGAGGLPAMVEVLKEFGLEIDIAEFKEFAMRTLGLFKS